MIIPNMQENTTAQPANNVSPQTMASKIVAVDVGEKTVLINFNGGFLSSDAGALLLREVEGQIGLIRKMAEVIPDSRDARYITHKITDFLIQRVAQIACGYEDANDCNTLRHDPIFKMIAGRYPEFGEALASQASMSRFENSISRTTLYRLARVFADMFIASYAEDPECIILDFDDTDDPVYGSQQLSLFNGYFKEHCYLPLHVYEGQSGKLITTILKPGKRSTGPQMLAIVKRVIGHLRATWPNTLILFRGDSHFAYPEVMEWLEAQDKVKYITGLSGNARLHKAVQPVVEQARRRYQRSGEEVKMFHAFLYQANTWNIPRRVVAKIEVTAKGLNVRFVVTDIRGLKAATIYQQGYCARGEDELYIKDHKRYLKSDRTSCNKFEANQFRLFLHSAAYVLIHTLKTNILKNTQFGHASIETIQRHLLKIGARVRDLKTRIWIELPSHYPLKKLLIRSFQMFEVLRSP